MPTISMLATAQFINAVVAVYGHNQGMDKVVLSLAIIIGCAVYSWLSPHAVELLQTKMENQLRKTLKGSLVERVAALKYRYIEAEESWNLISRVCREPEIQCSTAYIQLFDTIYLVLKAGGVLVVLFSQIWWAAILIFLVSIPVFRLAVKGGENNYAANREAEQYKRRADYLSKVLAGRDAVEERTLFGYSESINVQWSKQFEKARSIQLLASLKWCGQAELGGIVTSLLTGFVILLLVFPVSKGELTIGLFIAIVNQVMSLIPDLSWQMPEYAEAIAENKEYLADLTEFMKMEGNKEYLCLPDCTPVVVETVEFKNVAFRYPGNAENILKDVSFLLEKGKHYAFVGCNGAGKTTITKLMTGLYEEFEGTILINGISIKAYSQNQLKSMFSVVYQDFAQYSISLKENIALGNVNGCTEREIGKAVALSGLRELIRILPQGIESNLGKIRKKSTELSGGQWQRTAMARTLVSPASLRILDEPTAALDPVSENRVYEQFKEIGTEATTIFISHRLGSTRLADIIFVLDEGTLAEQGTFETLMQKNGIYRKMFESQRNWYVNG